MVIHISITLFKAYYTIRITYPLDPDKIWATAGLQKITLIKSDDLIILERKITREEVGSY